MTLLRYALISLATLTWSQPAHAVVEVAVFLGDAGGVAAADHERMAVALGRGYAKEAGVQILLPSDTAKVAKAATSPLAAAGALAVFDYIVVHSKLAGQKLEVSGILFHKDGSQKHQVAITALSVEDFEMMAPRMARALAKKETVVDTRSTDLLDEARPKRGPKGHGHAHGHAHAAPRSQTPEPAGAAAPGGSGAVAEAPPSTRLKAGHHLKHADLSKPTGGEVAVFPVGGTNIAAGEAQAIGVILAQAYAGVSRQQVLMPADTTDVLQAAGSLVAAARALAVAEYIDIRAVQLRSRMRLSLALHRGDGTIAHVVHYVAPSLDELEAQSIRLAAALFYRTTVDAIDENGMLADPAAARGGVNWDEGVFYDGDEPSRRLFARRIFGAKFQMTTTMAPHAAFDPTMTLQFDVRLEQERYFLELAAGFMIPSQAWQSDRLRIRRYGGLVTEFGASYYILNGDIGIYAGGGVIPRMLWGEDAELAIKMALYGQAGVMFFRKHRTRVYVDLRGAQNVIPFQSFNRRTNSARELYPTEITIAFGIGW